MTGTAVVDLGIEQVVQDFENATVEAAAFDHEAHIQVAWWYLQDYSLPDAISRYTGALRRLTRKLGVPSKYHETISWFYLIQIAERCSSELAADWPAFKAANRDLFAWNPSLIDKYYSKALLSSDIARRMFVLPDLTD